MLHKDAVISSSEGKYSRSKDAHSATPVNAASGAHNGPITDDGNLEVQWSSSLILKALAEQRAASSTKSSPGTISTPVVAREGVMRKANGNNETVMVAGLSLDEQFPGLGWIAVVVVHRDVRFL
jgi:hypothetical protein